MSDNVTITYKWPSVTIMWHGNNTHIRIESAGDTVEFTRLIAEALKRACLENHAEETQGTSQETREQKLERALQELLDWSQSGHGWKWGPIPPSYIDHIAKIVGPALHAKGQMKDHARD